MTASTEADPGAAGPGEVDPGAVDPGAVDPGALEAVLLVSDEPVAVATLAEVLDASADQVLAALHALTAGYDGRAAGIDLRGTEAGWRLHTRAEHVGVVERFLREGQRVRLTQAGLEALAVVAYAQPTTRGHVSAVRGVASDGVLRTLVARGLVEEAGTEPSSGAAWYRTTLLFLERLGVGSLGDLPPLAPHLPALAELAELAELAGPDPDPAPVDG